MENYINSIIKKMEDGTLLMSDIKTISALSEMRLWDGVNEKKIDLSLIRYDVFAYLISNKNKGINPINSDHQHNLIKYCKSKSYKILLQSICFQKMFK